MQRAWSVVRRGAIVGLTAAVAPAVVAGCQDPCIELAQRICNCESTVIERRACAADRITSQQGSVVLTDADRDLCATKLDTCSCAALDENDLDACGFVPVVGDAAAGRAP